MSTRMAFMPLTTLSVTVAAQQQTRRQVKYNPSREVLVRHQWQLKNDNNFAGVESNDACKQGAAWKSEQICIS
jgi:hypothetical protein